MRQSRSCTYRATRPESPGPAQQLAGFARVELAAGESQRISFTLRASQLGYTNLAGEFAVDPGLIEWHAGLDADDRAAAGTLLLTGASRLLSSAERTFLSEVVISDV